MRTVVDRSSETIVIEESDLREGASEIRRFDCVRWWTQRGKPEEDIEMEVPNLIGSARHYVAYQKMRDRLCSKYEITEHELGRHLFGYLATH